MLRFIMSIYVALTTVFTGGSIAATEQSGAAPPAWILELGVIVTNVLLIVVTFWLVRLEIKQSERLTNQVMEQEAATNRGLLRIIRQLTRGRAKDAKHARVGGDEE